MMIVEERAPALDEKSSNKNAPATTLLQQAARAYRAAPDAPTCQRSLYSRANSEASLSTKSTEPLLLDSEEEEEDAEENLSWANFPVVVRTEQHPSVTCYSLEFSFLTQEEVEEAAQEEDNEDDDEHDQPEEPLLRLKLNLAAQEAPPATFGWGDFPLVVQQQQAAVAVPSFYYPWRYHKADEKEEKIVPLAMSTSTTHHHHHAPPSASFGEETTAQPQTKVHQQQQEQQQRNVSFSVVRIREHAEILGDHPWCPQYPCSLDWRYGEEMVVPVDAYEQARDTCCWSSTPRRMDVLERRSRLARAMRVSRAEVDVMESYRQEFVAREKAKAEAAQQQEEENCEEPALQPHSMHRVPTMIVLPEER